MRRRTIGRIGSVIIFVMLFWFLYQKVEYTLVLKNSSERVHNYYKEEKNSLDVVFFGSSHSYYGIFPMEFWKDYGVPAYLLGTPIQSFGTAYYLMEEAVKTQKPKVMVVEAYVAYLEEKYHTEEEGMFQQAMDGMPLSMNKIQMGEDLLSDKTLEQRIPFYFPMVQYHSRWSGLKEKDFAGTDAHYKGGKPAVAKTVPFPEPKEVLGRRELPPVSKGYVDKMIDLCEEEDIALVFCLMPFAGTKKANRYPKQQRIYNDMEAYTAERGVPFLNYTKLADEVGVDYSTDFKDIGHMNATGALKVDRHLFSYLKEHYDLQDRRNDPGYEKWNEDCQRYEQEMDAKWKAAAGGKALVEDEDWEQDD